MCSVILGTGPPEKEGQFGRSESDFGVSRCPLDAKEGLTFGTVGRMSRE